ncbi:hypothetical protein FGO68_gene11773 [Halteria grandinella]|uniref:TLDc domain-containing protein n=1 Tax=Halteria grandinella TaxID=5974 RepID=A0A8J8T2H5_HALGN|nr:hypothetical protein FGO68_gene11773 [Halteria grandinella]
MNQLELLSVWILNIIIIKIKSQQMVEKQTVHQQLMNQMQNLPFCRVHPTEKVVYQCRQEQCPNFEKLKLYCFKCDDEDLHDHRSKLIVSQVNTSEASWKDLRQKLSQINDNVSTITDQFNDVIAALDQNLTNVTPQPKLADYFKLFNALYIDFNKFYEDFINQCIIVSDIIKLNEFNSQLSEFEQRLQALEYLSLAAPLIMWRFYSEIIADVQMFTLLEHLNLQSLTLVIQLKLQKSEISLQTITHQQQIPLHLTILENQGFNPSAEITRLLTQLNAIQCSDVMILSQVEKLRNQLDILGVTTSHISYKAQVNLKHQEQDSKIERMMKQIEELKQPQPQPAVQQQAQAPPQQQRQPQDLVQVPPQEQQNLFADSLILNDSTKKQTMIGYFTQMGKPSIKLGLIYRATRDGFGGKDFHRICDNKGPSLTIVLTTTDFVIGGYTSEHWDCSNKCKPSIDGWLFIIAHPHPFTRIKGDGWGIYCYEGYGAYFGRGDIGIRDKGDGWVHGLDKSLSYEFGGVHLLNGKGQTEFTAKEIEVYQVI